MFACKQPHPRRSVTPGHKPVALLSARRAIASVVCRLRRDREGEVAVPVVIPFNGSRYFSVQPPIQSAAQADRRLRSGNTQIVVEVPTNAKTIVRIAAHN
jgi:hypothetical protein